jgi:drug/metabolite transporter (DMT)-like permease
MSPRDLASLFLLGAIWGASFLFMRVAAPQFGPIALIEVRLVVATLFLLIVGARSGRLRGMRAHVRPLVVLGVFNAAVPFALFAFATLTLPAGFSSVLNATTPLFAAVFGLLWLRERIAPRRTLGLALGFAGVLALVWPKLQATDERLAVAAGLVAALLYALCVHYGKRALVNVPPFVTSTGSLLAAALALAPFALFSWPAVPPDARAWGAALALGIVCTAVAYVIYFRLITRVDPMHATVVTYLVPVFGIAWGALFLGESVTLAMLGGAGVVIAGVVLVTRPAARASR